MGLEEYLLTLSRAKLFVERTASIWSFRPTNFYIRPLPSTFLKAVVNFYNLKKVYYINIII